MARKNFIWDVALVAASFCVQFDGDVRPEYSGKKLETNIKKKQKMQLYTSVNFVILC